MPPPTDHAKAVRDYLDANLGLSGVSVYAGQWRDGMDDRAITIRETGGTQQRTYGETFGDVNDPTVQVMTRAAEGQRQQAKDDADAVWAAMRYARLTDYELVYTEQPQSLPVGPDDEGRFRFSVNLRLTIQE